MASLKAEKSIGTQLFGQKEAAGAGGSTTKAPASKPAPKKTAPKKTVEPKKKAAGVKKPATKKQ
ncbi:hypothetical protein V2J09_011662 [Rumex salicifolius]